MFGVVGAIAAAAFMLYSSDQENQAQLNTEKEAGNQERETMREESRLDERARQKKVEAAEQEALAYQNQELNGVEQGQQGRGQYE